MIPAIGSFGHFLRAAGNLQVSLVDHETVGEESPSQFATIIAVA